MGKLIVFALAVVAIVLAFKFGGDFFASVDETSKIETERANQRIDAMIAPLEAANDLE